MCSQHKGNSPIGHRGRINPLEQSHAGTAFCYVSNTGDRPEYNFTARSYKEALAVHREIGRELKDAREPEAGEAGAYEVLVEGKAHRMNTAMRGSVKMPVPYIPLGRDWKVAHPDVSEFAEALESVGVEIGEAYVAPKSHRDPQPQATPGMEFSPACGVRGSRQSRRGGWPPHGGEGMIAKLLSLIGPSRKEVVERIPAKIEAADFQLRRAACQIVDFLDALDARARGEEIARELTLREIGESAAVAMIDVAEVLRTVKEAL
jgi:hypothetical protein